MSDRTPVYSRTVAGYVGDVDTYGEEFFALIYKTDPHDHWMNDLGSFPTSVQAIAEVDNLLAFLSTLAASEEAPTHAAA